ncbi:MAG: TIGR02594 family protein [Pseudolabrys sp.]
MKIAAAVLALLMALAAALPAHASGKRSARFDDVTTSEPIARSRTDAAEIAASVPGAGAILLEALRYRGRTANQLGLPTQLWCADFMNLVLRKAGGKGTSSRAARSFLNFGKKLDGPRVGAIVIFRRGGPLNGHVGIVRGTDGKGNPIVISGNSGKVVRQSMYPKERVLGYMMPPQYVLDDIANAARAEARADALRR